MEGSNQRGKAGLEKLRFDGIFSVWRVQTEQMSSASVCLLAVRRLLLQTEAAFDTVVRFSSRLPPPAMDRLQLLLVGFPIFLFCSDLIRLFSPPPYTPSKPPPPRHYQSQPQSVPQVPDFAAVQGSQVRGSGYHSVVELKFCASCSYRVKCQIPLGYIANYLSAAVICKSNKGLLPSRKREMEGN
ncbi:SelT-like protein [Platanthera guangdongensis]|uniref:SelT-like protein n=1 Tax=Platanthera guangdongensis TaxID=2320717 RepID=A0ABR2LT23_9ASPA